MSLRKQRFSLLKQPCSSLLNEHLIDYPTPSNLSYWWGFGSLAGICLVIQIVTGVFLAMHYTPHVDLAITIKAIGHQWYWTYEYSDYNSSDEESLTFDSYMISEEDLDLGQLRLLEVDNRVVVPANSHLRMIVTSADVLHSWTVPSLGVKCDAVPGRLNQISTFLEDLLAGIYQTLMPLTMPYFVEGSRMEILELRGAPAPEEPQAPAPIIPQLAHPLIEERMRRAELYRAVTIHFLGRTDFASLTHAMDIIQNQMLLEMRIEAALCRAGIDPSLIVRERRNIRSIIFYNGDRMVSAATLQRYLVGIEQRGTYLSVPYQKLMRAMRRGDVF